MGCSVCESVGGGACAVGKPVGGVTVEVGALLGVCAGGMRMKSVSDGGMLYERLMTVGIYIKRRDVYHAERINDENR